jgi:hypothetical protein
MSLPTDWHHWHTGATAAPQQQHFEVQPGAALQLQVRRSGPAAAFQPQRLLRSVGQWAVWRTAGPQRHVGINRDQVEQELRTSSSTAARNAARLHPRQQK